MAEYELTPAAELDLLDIALYTIETWGTQQAERYETALEEHLAALGRGEALTKTPLEHWPELRLSRCEHHDAFSLERAGAPPLVLAVFHEKLDLVARLRERLDVGGW